MALVLGSYAFDESRTSAVEEHAEIGGRDARTICIKGVLAGTGILSDLEGMLDAILREASETGVALSIRSGRQLLVRRVGFTREISRDALVASFELNLEAENPFEEAVTEASLVWTISSSGATQAVGTSGNVYALPKLTLVAAGSVVAPTIGDGIRTIAYTGVVADSETLVLDSALRKITLEGVDVTPYTTGLFPQVDPAGTVLTYTDDVSSSHTASVTVALRDRWW